MNKNKQYSSEINELFTYIDQVNDISLFFDKDDLEANIDEIEEKIEDAYDVLGNAWAAIISYKNKRR